MRVSILGREGDFETLEFSLQFSLGGLGDKSEGCVSRGLFRELTIAIGLLLSDIAKGSPADWYASMPVSVWLELLKKAIDK